MAIELMQGPRFAKQFVTQYLADDLPSRLTVYRNGWGLDDESLPDPLEFLTYEPVGLDTWPCIITIAMSTNSMTRIDYVEELFDPIYRVDYSMRTYIWVRADTATEGDQMRDNLTTVVRSALLDYPSVKYSDAENRDVLIDEGSIREEFSELTLLKGDRVLAGAYISYSLSLNEIVARNPIAEISDTQVETVRLA